MQALADWEKEREAIQQTLWKLLGNLPLRPTHLESQHAIVSHTDIYTLESFNLDNGVGEIIPTLLATPKHITPPYPTVLYLHVHGHRYSLGKNELFANRVFGIPIDQLTQAGYAVMCIDAYCFGERAGKYGDWVTGEEEHNLVKQFLLEGKTLWGMMLRDDLIALDYLHARADIDTSRIVATGMSLGSTRAWWLAALDERIKVTVAVACMTRYAELISTGHLANHNFYFYVPQIMQHFDTEAIVSLIAPRPLLVLTGDNDPTSPVVGVQKIASAVEEIYALYDAKEHFENVIYTGVGHEHTVDMWDATMQWLDQHL